MCPCQNIEAKTILKGVSGIAKKGEVTVIMGSSGAGKTTLLNILACRIPLGDQIGMASGKLYANYLEYTDREFGQFANYVMQDDIFLETLTVRETLLYAAAMKLDLDSG